MRTLHANILGFSLAILWLAYIINMEHFYTYQLVDKVLHKDPIVHKTEDNFVIQAWKVEYNLVSRNSRQTITRYYSDYYLAETFEPDFSSYLSGNMVAAIHVSFFFVYLIVLFAFFIITVFNL